MRLSEGRGREHAQDPKREGERSFGSVALYRNAGRPQSTATTGGLTLWSPAYRLSVMLLVALAEAPPFDVNVAFAVSFRLLEALSSFRPLLVSVIWTIASPTWWNTAVAEAISVCCPFTVVCESITSFPAPGAVNENEYPPAFKTAAIFAAIPVGASTFDRADLTCAAVGPAATAGPTSLAVAWSLPAVFVAVTTTSSFAPSSPAMSVYELHVAPPMFEQPGSHSCH